ncbi:DUF6624 domain-containing protein [Pontibacter chitinilyticus]|uniref:DUF6624 domain-containing protein n=1 Tax=Pontibacter chitinilyticus TaxID=2674989 RepID=UPI0032194EBF
MKTFLLTLVCLSFFVAAFAQTAQDAFIKYEAKEYKAAAKLYDKALQSGKGNSIDYYNAACCWAQAGNKKKSFEHLEKALQSGWKDLDYLQHDSVLVSLHSDKRWNALVQQLQEKLQQDEAHYNQPLKARLEAIFETNQRYLHMIDSVQTNYGMASEQWKKLESRIEVRDKANLKEVTAILDNYGWPGKSLVGAKGSMAAFLVLQHADVRTQEKYVPLMRAAAEKGEASKVNLALLEDAILTGNGKPQIYGSQVRLNPATHLYELYPILDEPHVDSRRLQIGLPPLKEYLKRFGIQYETPSLDRGPHNE